MSPVYVGLQRTFRSDRKTGAVASFLIHAVFFFVGGAMFVRGAEYGVETGGGIEIDLIAAPMAAPIEAPPQEVAIPREDENSLVTTQLEPASIQLPAHVLPPPIIGDGSSSIPGKDSTTLHSVGGAQTEASPNYLKNPAPRYPEVARKAGQQGLVLLSASIDSHGKPRQIVIKNGSGYTLLDIAALDAVRRWKFKPAKAASMNVDSQVEIPIRFQIEENL